MSSEDENDESSIVTRLPPERHQSSTVSSSSVEESTVTNERPDANQTHSPIGHLPPSHAVESNSNTEPHTSVARPVSTTPNKSTQDNIDVTDLVKIEKEDNSLILDDQKLEEQNSTISKDKSSDLDIEAGSRGQSLEEDKSTRSRGESLEGDDSTSGAELMSRLNKLLIASRDESPFEFLIEAAASEGDNQHVDDAVDGVTEACNTDVNQQVSGKEGRVFILLLYNM